MITDLSDYLTSLYDGGGERLGRSMALWQSGVQSEIDFWSNWFATKGSEWPDDYKTRMQPQPLVPWIIDLLPKTQEKLRILDVGAGPISKMGTYVPDQSAEIIAVDPLANYYNKIAFEHDIELPLATQLAFAEDLSCHFDESSFDLINCQNALDHSIEPMWGVIEMCLILKTGGVIFLAHRKNEAEFENYDGLHQWNFDDDNGEFIIWNKERRLNVSQILSSVAKIENSINNDILSVVIRKHDEFKFDTVEYQKKLRAGLTSSLLSSNVA